MNPSNIDPKEFEVQTHGYIGEMAEGESHSSYMGRALSNINAEKTQLNLKFNQLALETISKIDLLDTKTEIFERLGFFSKLFSGSLKKEIKTLTTEIDHLIHLHPIYQECLDKVNAQISRFQTALNTEKAKEEAIKAMAKANSGNAPVVTSTQAIPDQTHPLEPNLQGNIPNPPDSSPQEDKIAAELYSDPVYKEKIVTDLKDIIKDTQPRIKGKPQKVDPALIQEDAESIYDHLKQLPTKRTIPIADYVHSKMYATPLMYTFPGSSAGATDAKPIPLAVPKEIINRFDGHSFSFNSKMIKKGTPKVPLEETKANVITFCQTIHQKLIDKAGGDAEKIKKINENITQILSTALDYACMDGLGGMIAVSDHLRIQLQPPLNEKYTLTSKPKQEFTSINFEVDDQFNLLITYTLINELGVRNETTSEAGKSNLSSYTSASVKIDLNNPLVPPSKIELTTSPYNSSVSNPEKEVGMFAKFRKYLKS